MMYLYNIFSDDVTIMINIICHLRIIYIVVTYKKINFLILFLNLMIYYILISEFNLKLFEHTDKSNFQLFHILSL